MDIVSPFDDGPAFIGCYRRATARTLVGAQFSLHLITQNVVIGGLPESTQCTGLIHLGPLTVGAWPRQSWPTYVGTFCLVEEIIKTLRASLSCLRHVSYVIAAFPLWAV